MSISLERKQELEETYKKVEFLLNKLNLLENSLKEERAIRLKLEDENKYLQQNRIPELLNNIEEKENLNKNILIQKLRIEKEFLEKTKHSQNDFILLRQPSSEEIPNSILTSKIEFYKNCFENEKKKNSELKLKINQQEKELNENSKLFEQKYFILEKENDKLQQEITNLNKNIEKLSQGNKNLLNELSSLNNLHELTLKDKEVLEKENTFYKSEVQSLKNTEKDLKTKLNRLDYVYGTVSQTLSDLNNTISDKEFNNFIFNVVRIGRLYESDTDLIFTKDDLNNYVIIFKYMTTSFNCNVLEIENILFKEGTDNVIVIMFNEAMNKKAEKFRTNDAVNIIKVYNEMKKKALQKSDNRTNKNEKDNKEKKIKESIQRNLLDWNF